MPFIDPAEDFKFVVPDVTDLPLVQFAGIHDLPLIIKGD
jgi:hypothetical protein